VKRRLLAARIQSQAGKLPPGHPGRLFFWKVPISRGQRLPIFGDPGRVVSRMDPNSSATAAPRYGAISSSPAPGWRRRSSPPTRKPAMCVGSPKTPHGVAGQCIEGAGAHSFGVRRQPVGVQRLAKARTGGRTGGGPDEADVRPRLFGSHVPASVGWPPPGECRK
jgi:hypothetical protein